MTAPTRIDTDRLVLAPPEAADAAAIFERYASDADVTRYVGWPRHGSLADTESFLAFSAVEWARAGAGPYLIRSRLDGRLFGGTGLHVDVPGVAMTGYVLAKDAWGLGYATEALRAMIRRGTSHPRDPVVRALPPRSPAIVARAREMRVHTGPGVDASG